MKRNSDNSKVPVQEQAASWLVELGEQAVDEGTRREFIGWLKQSPQHIREFLEIAALEHDLTAQSSTVAGILQELEATRNEKVLSSIGVSHWQDDRPQPRIRRRWHYLACASAASIVLTATIFMLRTPGVEPPVTVHRTDLGEQRSIALNDGSIVTLNTLSEATVRFDDTSRHVRLISGEAMFEIVEDPDRAFLVETDVMSLRVIGTKFSVYRKAGSVHVAVVDGIVSAETARDPDAKLLLRGGEGIVIDRHGNVLLDHTLNVEKAVAWTERRLIFDNAPLADVVGEFNRYNRLPLVVEDELLAERQVTTVFNAHDVSALIAFLQLQPGIEVVYSVDAIRIRTGRP